MTSLGILRCFLSGARLGSPSKARTHKKRCFFCCVAKALERFGVGWKFLGRVKCSPKNLWPTSNSARVIFTWCCCCCFLGEVWWGRSFYTIRWVSILLHVGAVFSCIVGILEVGKLRKKWMMRNTRSGQTHGMWAGQFITTSAEVTPNGGLVRESPPKWP